MLSCTSPSRGRHFFTILFRSFQTRVGIKLRVPHHPAQHPRQEQRYDAHVGWGKNGPTIPMQIYIREREQKPAGGLGLNVPRMLNCNVLNETVGPTGGTM